MSSAAHGARDCAHWDDGGRRDSAGIEERGRMARARGEDVVGSGAGWGTSCWVVVSLLCVGPFSLVVNFGIW